MITCAGPCEGDGVGGQGVVQGRKPGATAMRSIWTRNFGETGLARSRSQGASAPETKRASGLGRCCQDSEGLCVARVSGRSQKPTLTIVGPNGQRQLSEDEREGRHGAVQTSKG